MIERAIENWLTNTNERNYQTPFCQVLFQKGHTPIYISSHGLMEQGKDIVTIAPDGDCCAYQLKTGKIDIAGWRKMRGEVEELMQLPVVHPSVDSTKTHKSFLVTNGEINESVRLQIVEMNRDNKQKGRNYSYLEIINGQELLREFIGVQGRFVPKQLQEFSSFLNLFLSDGTDFFLKDKYFGFLTSTFFSDFPRQKSVAVNAVSGSIIMTGYLLNPYQTENNYYALFEAWTCLASCITWYAKKTKLRKSDWLDSWNLVLSEITRNLFLLNEEILRREDFLEGSWRGDGGPLYNARATIVLGVLAALELHLHKVDRDHGCDNRLLERVRENLDILFFWGESSFPYFFSLIKYLELNNENQLALSLLDKIFGIIVNSNSAECITGLPNPYYGVTDVLEAGFSMKEIDFAGFAGSSYTLEAMILMMARRNRRKLLKDNWRILSHIQFEEFRVDNAEDLFLWRAKKGSNYWEFPNTTQSWAELLRRAKASDSGTKIYQENLELLRFLILICPHRATSEIIGLLDEDCEWSRE